MKHRLKKVKEDTRNLCQEITEDLNSIQKIYPKSEMNTIV